MIDAWQAGDPEEVAIAAWNAVEDLRRQGLEPKGIDLLDLVLARSGESRYDPALQAMRGDLNRARGLFDLAFADLALAEQMAHAEAAEEDRDFALHHVHGYRAQVWLDLGLLLLADEELREESA